MTLVEGDSEEVDTENRNRKKERPFVPEQIETNGWVTHWKSAARVDAQMTTPRDEEQLKLWRSRMQNGVCRLVLAGKLHRGIAKCVWEVTEKLQEVVETPRLYRIIAMSRVLEEVFAIISSLEVRGQVVQSFRQQAATDEKLEVT